MAQVCPRGHLCCRYFQGAAGAGTPLENSLPQRGALCASLPRPKKCFWAILAREDRITDTHRSRKKQQTKKLCSPDSGITLGAPKADKRKSSSHKLLEKTLGKSTPNHEVEEISFFFSVLGLPDYLPSKARNEKQQKRAKK